MSASFTNTQLADATRRAAIINEWSKPLRLANYSSINYSCATDGEGILFVGRVIDALIDHCDNAETPEKAWAFDTLAEYGPEWDDFTDLAHELADETVAGLIYYTDIAQVYVDLGGWEWDAEVADLLPDGGTVIEQMRVALYAMARDIVITAAQRAIAVCQ